MHLSEERRMEQNNFPLSCCLKKEEKNKERRMKSSRTESWVWGCVIFNSVSIWWVLCVVYFLHQQWYYNTTQSNSFQANDVNLYLLSLNMKMGTWCSLSLSNLLILLSFDIFIFKYRSFLEEGWMSVVQLEWHAELLLWFVSRAKCPSLWQSSSLHEWHKFVHPRIVTPSRFHRLLEGHQMLNTGNRNPSYIDWQFPKPTVGMVNVSATVW